jgi:general secretion pathway protein M
MSSALSSSSASTAFGRLAQRWAALAPRQQIFLGLAAALIGGLLVWNVAIAPALSTLKKVRTQSHSLDTQLQSMRSMAGAAASLKSQRSLSYDESVKALQAAAQQSLGSSAQVSISDGRAIINLRAASPDALAQFLAQLRANARLMPAELRLQKSTTPATPGVSASTAAAPTAIIATAWDGQISIGLPAR